MTRSELIAQVARKSGLTQADAARAVDAMDAVLSGDASDVADAMAPRGPVGTLTYAAGADVAPEASTPVQQIRDLAARVWENSADAEEFLSTPHALLDDRTPSAASQTPQGAERVRRILLALEYGLPV